MSPTMLRAWALALYWRAGSTSCLSDSPNPPQVGHHHVRVRSQSGDDIAEIVPTGWLRLGDMLDSTYERLGPGTLEL
jgi:hypothetical protein